MTTQIFKDKIRSFIHELMEERLGLSIEGLEDSTALISTGIINSLNALQIIVFFENDLKLEIRAEHIEPQNFDSIDLLSDFAERISNENGSNT